MNHETDVLCENILRPLYKMRRNDNVNNDQTILNLTGYNLTYGRYDLMYYNNNIVTNFQINSHMCNKIKHTVFPKLQSKK